MQKFTRPLTREIELAGERLAFTFDETGIAIRPVGSRRPPKEITWAALLVHLTGLPPAAGETPSPEVLTAALDRLKTSGSSRQGTRSSAKSSEQSAEQQRSSPPAGTEQASRTQDYTALLARLERWLAEHRPRYLHALLTGASAAELDELQANLGLALPTGLRTLLHWHNGQRADFVGCFEQSWNLLSSRDIAKAKTELDTDPTGANAKSGWQKNWLPFLADNGSDYLCLDMSRPEVPVREFWLGKTEQPIIAPSLASWLESFVTALERGDYSEDPERGELLRRGK